MYFCPVFNNRFHSDATGAVKRNRPIRVLTLFWLIFVFFTTSAFECNLRAHLLSVDYEEPIDWDKVLYYISLNNSFAVAWRL